MVYPQAVIGEVEDIPANIAVCINGTSIESGQGETTSGTNANFGYVERALFAAGVPWIRQSVPASNVQNFIANSTKRRSFQKRLTEDRNSGPNENRILALTFRNGRYCYSIHEPA